MHPNLRPYPHRRAPAPAPAPAPTPVPAPQSLDPDEVATFSAASGDDGASLASDPGHGGTNSAIPVQTITVTDSKSSPTAAAPTSTPTRPPQSSKSKLGTGAIIGIAVGIFALLAITMVTIMTIKHKRKMASRRERQRSAARAAADQEQKGTAMRMTEKQPRSPGSPLTPNGGTSYASPSAALAAVAPPPPVFRGHASSVPDDESFLSLKSTNSLQRIPPSAPQSNNPFLPSQQQQQRSQAQMSNHAGSSSTSSSNGIPNPFSSPSPSRTPSNATTASAATMRHAPSPSAASIDATMLASFPAIQYANTMNAHFSISDYTDPDPSSPPADLDHYLYPPQTASTTGYLSAAPRTPVNVIVPPTPPIQASSNKPVAREARAREMRGLADLITALDSAPSTAPSSWIAPGDYGESGSSRLSRGEGLVTPVDGTHGGIIASKAQTIVKGTGTLPPTELFRAALAPDSITDKKGKGRARNGNPFEG